MPADALRLFLLAGEPSGDRIGADLLRRLHERTSLAVTGVGGAAMAGEGLVSLYPMSDLSVMGFADVARRLPLLLWRAQQTVSAILAAQPDVVVLIDSQVFSATVARRLRRRGYSRPIVLYVAPAVWAWKPERAPALKPLFDEVLAVLPFEPAAMARLGGPPTHFAGHPALARFAFRPAMPKRGPLLLLPGSRAGEIRRNLPLIRDVATRLRDHKRVSGLLLPTPRHLLERMAAETAGWEMKIAVIAGEDQVRQGFAKAVAAVAVTGTVTLELALSGVPMATTYVADAGQKKRFEQYHVKFAALPNILLDRAAVPEFLALTPDAAAIAAALRRLLDDSATAKAQLEAFAQIRALVEKGAPGAPLVDPAERVLTLSAR